MSARRRPSSLAANGPIKPGYRWRPSASEWDAILREHGESIKARFSSDPAGTSIDVNTPEGKKRLLEFWLTTEEEGYQIVPNRRRRGARRLSAGTAEGRGPAAGGQGMNTPDPLQSRRKPIRCSNFTASTWRR